MATLREYAAGVDDILRPYGDLDLLLYYGLIAEKLQKFLHGRELATRTWVPGGRVRSVVKRGSTYPTFYVRQMAAAITPGLIEAREKYENLDDARHMLSPEQALAWLYFAPRRYIEFYYATNREGDGRDISRVVYDVGRGKNTPAEDAVEVTALLAQAVLEDDPAGGLFRESPLVAWTGSSFQVILSLRETKPAAFYREQIEYTGKGTTLTDRLISRVQCATNVPVSGGPVPPPGHVAIDPSTTPSGQLCRVPLGSLRMDSASAVSSLSLPLTADMLRRDAVADLQAYTPGRVIDELDELAGRLPG